MKKLIEQIVAEVKGTSGLADELPEDAHIVYDLGLDSLQLIDLLLRIQEELDLEIDFDMFDFTHLESVAALNRFLSQQIRNANVVV